MNEKLFEELSQLNVNEYVEQKNGLNYLSWAYAITEICKKYNTQFSYTIKKFDRNLPYVYDENTGYMVFTEITLCGQTREMWLPVMDNNNNAMLSKSYEYQVKKYEKDPVTKKNIWKGEYETKTVQPATMFDVNKTIMRCLVKNLAMFGLGMYIYAGEDLPESTDNNEIETKKEKSVQPKVVINSSFKPKNITLVCQSCNKQITESVAKFSKDKFGKELCFDCQKAVGGAK